MRTLAMGQPVTFTALGNISVLAVAEGAVQVMMFAGAGLEQAEGSGVANLAVLLRCPVPGPGVGLMNLVAGLAVLLAGVTA